MPETVVDDWTLVNDDAMSVTRDNGTIVVAVEGASRVIDDPDPTLPLNIRRFGSRALVTIGRDEEN